MLLETETAVCRECKKSFSNIFGLRRHIKIKHLDKFELLAPSVSVKKPVCGVCKKTFSKTSNLRAHVKKMHPDKLESLAPKVYHTVITCSQCNKGFVHKKNWKKHIRIKHPNEVNALLPPRKSRKKREKSNTIIRTKKCTLCGYISPKKDNAISHYREAHDISIETDNFEFSSFEEFNSWKMKIEKETFSSFVNKQAYKITSGTKIVYNCHRSGYYRSKSNGLRCLKRQGSNKIEGYCPAKITLIARGAKCEVEFLKTHVGHEQDLEHLSLTTDQRMELAAKISAKMSFTAILDDIRKSASDSNLERIHLVRRKDLTNIEKSFKRNNGAIARINAVVGVEKSAANNLIVEISDDESESMEIVEPISSLNLKQNVEIQRENVKHNILDLLSYVEGASQEEIDIIESFLKPVMPALKALNKGCQPLNAREHSVNNSKFVFSTKENTDRRNLVSKPSSNSSELVGQQQDLFSTKKNTERQNVPTFLSMGKKIFLLKLVKQ